MIKEEVNLDQKCKDLKQIEMKFRKKYLDLDPIIIVKVLRKKK